MSSASGGTGAFMLTPTRVQFLRLIDLSHVMQDGTDACGRAVACDPKGCQPLHDLVRHLVYDFSVTHEARRRSQMTQEIESLVRRLQRG
jgi:hypothetical protein